MSEKKTNRPDRHAIYNAVITRMVNEGLGKKEEAFAFIYSNATDEELLAYLRKCASELGHSPWPKEIVGWIYITERFGDWKTALHKAHLPNPKTPNHPMSFQLVMEEYEIQKQIYRKNKADKNAKAAQRRAEQEKKKKAKEKAKAKGTKQVSAPPLRVACEQEAV